jgi:hypothetical protein
MTRQGLIERILRLVYGDQPSDDSAITYSLVNQWINDGIAIAVKNHYKENIQIDGVGYINNSFYINYKGLAIVPDEQLTFKITLPEIPTALGRNEGISIIQFKSNTNQVSYPGILLSENELAMKQSLRIPPNGLLCWPEGNFIYVESTLPLFQYTASVRMISGGDSTNLSSTLNIPQEYIPIIIEYVSKYLSQERSTPKDDSNDGSDN